MRSALLSCLLILATVSIARGQESPGPTPTLSVTPAAGDLNTTHQARIDNLPSGAPLLILFAPDGSQTMLRPYADNGSYVAALVPPSDGWTPGLYRVVLGIDGGGAVSRTFTAGTHPALYFGPDSPSPTSVFTLIGTNLTPSTLVDVHLFLTGGIQGERVISATTDDSGAFCIYVWPEALGFPFFPAGIYRATIPAYDLSAELAAREHPVSATLTADDSITSGQPIALHFTQYRADRYLWGVYAAGNGPALGEFLAGPTSLSEIADLSFSPGSLAAGEYYLATPYDWGETSVTALALPTATPTVTPSPTATVTPTPHTTCKKHSKKGKKKKKGCKR